MSEFSGWLAEETAAVKGSAVLPNLNPLPAFLHLSPQSMTALCNEAKCLETLSSATSLPCASFLEIWLEYPSVDNLKSSLQPSTCFNLMISPYCGLEGTVF
jgi:hypothetical protein